MAQGQGAIIGAHGLRVHAHLGQGAPSLHLGELVVLVDGDGPVKALDRLGVLVHHCQGYSLADEYVEVLRVQLKGLIIGYYGLLVPAVGHQGHSAGPPQPLVGRVEGDGLGQSLGPLGEPSRRVKGVPLDHPETGVRGEQLRSVQGFLQGTVVLLLIEKRDAEVTQGVLVPWLQLQGLVVQLAGLLPPTAAVQRNGRVHHCAGVLRIDLEYPLADLQDILVLAGALVCLLQRQEDLLLVLMGLEGLLQHLYGFMEPEGPTVSHSQIVHGLRVVGFICQYLLAELDALVPHAQGGGDVPLAGE